MKIQSFTKAYEKIKKRYSYLTLIEYNGSNNDAVFIDSDYGEFIGKFKNVYKGDKSHPERGLKNMLQKRKETFINKYGVDNPSKSKDVRDKYTQTMIEKYGVEHPTQSIEIKEKIKQTNLERYNVEYSLQSDAVRDKIKKTCIEKYGVEHISQSQNFKDNIKKSNLEKYNVECTLQLPEVKDKSKITNLKKYGEEYFSRTKHFKEKRKETCIRKYGTYHESQNNNFKDKIKQTNIKNGNWKNIDGYTIPEFYELQNYDFSLTTFYCAINNIGIENALQYNNHKSDIENIISAMLHDNKILFIFNKQINVENKERPDFLIEDNKLIIECDGLYYHSDTEGAYKKIRDKKNFHKERQEKYKEIGYKSLFFRGDEILNKTNIVKSIILAKLSRYNNRIFARKTKIIDLDSKTASEFFEENHLMGRGKGQCYALIYEDKIVSAIRIIKKKNYIDISRFCSTLHTNVVGGLGKLLKHIIRKHNPQKIMSFVDMRYGDGHSLEKLGFVEKTNHVSFKWTDFKNTFHRMNFKGNSGYEKGLFKIWDCGQKKFELQL